MKKQTVYVFLMFLLLLGGLVVVGVLRSRGEFARNQLNSNRSLVVISTIYPWADVAKQIGGDLVTVTTLTPPGVEPHDYEPTPQDLVRLYQADVVILNGWGVDAWADKLVDPLRAKDVSVIRLSDEQLMQEVGTALGGQDPHFWLDPVLVSQAAERISSDLALDSPRSVEILAQKDLYASKLQELDRSYRTGLGKCQRKELVTTHDAFQYLAKRYALTPLPILGRSPEEDPSPQTIARLIDVIQQKGVKTIFFESLVSSKLAQTIAEEVGAQTSVLNPLEGLTQAELAAGKDYILIMQENLVQLRTALGCL